MRRTGPAATTVALVLARDHHSCRRCAMRLHGERGIDWVLHHRRPRAMGGTRRADTNSPSNLVALCTRCHTDVESHRDEARHAGWLVAQHDDPDRVPVRTAGLTTDFLDAAWVYLLADGTESDRHPDVITPVVDGEGREVLSEAAITDLHAKYRHLLAEAAERAEEDMAVLAIEIHPDLEGAA